MNWLGFVVAVIALMIIRRIVFKKIDQDEQKALSTPGRAEFIRTHFQEVVTYLENVSDYEILFERADMIRIGLKNGNEYFAVSNYSAGLMIAYVKYSSVVKEWKFSRTESSKHVIYEISQVVK